MDDETIVVAFKLQRRPHVCPDCGGITEKSTTTETSGLKTFLPLVNLYGFILNVVIAVLTQMDLQKVLTILLRSLSVLPMDIGTFITSDVEFYIP